MTDPGIDNSKRRFQARLKLREFYELERRVRKELHDITLRRQELEDQLRVLKARRGSLLVDTRHDLTFPEQGELLGVGRDTVERAFNAEMKKRGMGAWVDG